MQLTKESLISTVEDIIQNELNIPMARPLKGSDCLRAHVGLDSLNTLSLLMALENKVANFMVDPDTLEPERIRDVDALVDFVLSAAT